MTLKNFTVRILKDLARKHLGVGLQAAPPTDSDARFQSRPINTHQEVEEEETGIPAEASPAPAVAEPSPATERAAHTLAAVEPPPEPAPAEPLIEGFFVARVQGEDEARRHHLTEDQVPPPLETGAHPHWIEHLPEIPRVYGDDRIVLLVRDPATAYVYWDISEQTRRAAFEGLRDPRTVLRVYEFGRDLRTIDVALESLSWFITGLTPGRTYRVELYAVSSDHISRRMGAASNSATLPPDDLSPDTTVRFMRVDWDAPLNRMKEHLQTGRAGVRTPEEVPDYLEIVHRRWLPLPTSGSWQLAESVERIPRPRPPEERPEIGGSSSFTMLGSSSWWSSPTSGWSFSGASRAPTRNGEGT